MELLLTHAEEILHLVLFFLWPLGTGGLCVSYIVTYWLSKRRDAWKHWVYVNFVLLVIALNYDERNRYRMLFLVRDMILITALHRHLVKQEDEHYQPHSRKSSSFLWTLNMLAILVPGIQMLKGESITPIHLAPFVHDLLMVLMDMVQRNLEDFFSAQYASNTSRVIYYCIAVAKALMYSQTTHNVPYLQLVTLFQLDLMSYHEDRTVHCLFFKMLSTAYLLSCFLL